MDIAALHKKLTETEAGRIGKIVDHLVDALAGDPSAPMRRAQILVYIDSHEGTTQAEAMRYLEIDKSTMTRDIEWLYDQGCIVRKPGTEDGRTLHLFTVSFSRQHLYTALEYFGDSHEYLQEFLKNFIKLFGSHKPTMRDAKIVCAIGDKALATKKQILDELYGGPVSTDSRSLSSLIEEGIVEKHG